MDHIIGRLNSANRCFFSPVSFQVTTPKTQLHKIINFYIVKKTLLNKVYSDIRNRDKNYFLAAKILIIKEQYFV